MNDNKATLRQLQDELATLPAPVPQPQVNPQLAVEREQRIAALGAALQGRMAWDRVLREISAVLPVGRLAEHAHGDGADGSAVDGATTDSDFHAVNPCRHAVEPRRLHLLAGRRRPSAQPPGSRPRPPGREARPERRGDTGRRLTVISFSINASVRPQVTG